MAEDCTPLYCTDDETSLLDLPDEVLTQIISLLTPRERVPFGNSCKRFESLVFEDPQLLRYLDFSKKGGLTTMTQIQQYFNNENACQHVLRVNAENVRCLKTGDPLNNSIGRAINLVEVNIHGTQFEDIWQLDSFLKPLQHLEKLLIDWPMNVGNDLSLCRRILQRPFSKLTYLSVRFEKAVPKIFPTSLPLCQKLKELYMEKLDYEPGIHRFSWNSKIKQLTNLKIVQYHGDDAMEIKEKLTPVLPDPKRWTDFQLCGGTRDHQSGFYIEKDVEVCEELMQSKNLLDILNTAPWEDFNLKWALNPGCLLKEVLKITHQDVPDDLCCLSRFARTRKHLLKVEEAKLLLKDPTYQISYLYLNHSLERGCDAHLLASAFPNLSELVLHEVTRNLGTSPEDSHFQRRLTRRGSAVPEKQDDSSNLDSSFKMLVENTPHLRHVTLSDHWRSRDKKWDLDALCHISGWQNLETLHMRDIPVEDGRFLIEIGKRCKNLQKLSLLIVYSSSCDKVALFEMFKYCRNLRDLTIRCSDIDQAEMFASLAKNVQLERLKAYNIATLHSPAPWISSLENMMHRCGKLTTINCTTKFKTEDDRTEALSAVKRIRGECSRPDFQIQLVCYHHKTHSALRVGTAFEDCPQIGPFPV